MKRIRRGERGRASRGGEAFVKLAIAAASAGSRIEDAFWSARLVDAVRPALTGSGQAGIESALDRLANSNARAYDLLADATEAAVESATLTRDGAQWDCLMFTVPVLAWSRTRIPSGPMREADVLALSAQLSGHVFAQSARVVLEARVLTPDQLPASYAEEASLARSLFKAVLDGATFIKGERPEQAVDFVSDSRYVIGAVAVPHGQPMFIAQEEESAWESAQQQWLIQSHAVMTSLLAGTQFEVLAPGAFYSTLRRADRVGRSFYLSSGVAYISVMAQQIPERITAAFAPFYDEQGLAEYRIGLTVGRSDEVHHGVTWPVLSEGDEDEAPTQIREALTQAGVREIVEHEHRFPLEYCEDCGAPLFPNIAGEVEHAELPESADQAPMQLH